MADSILKESLVGELVVAERICQECTQEFQNFKAGLMELSETEFSDIQRNHLYSQPEPSQRKFILDNTVFTYLANNKFLQCQNRTLKGIPIALGPVGVKFVFIRKLLHEL